MRIHPKTAVLLAATVLAGAAGTTAAQAAPAAAPAPSACRPANHLAKITRAPGSAGHRHYRVTLKAPRGYAPCRLAGSPADVRFSAHGSTLALSAGRYGDQRATAVLGPGHPVHFDIQVPDTRRGTAADGASFTLRAPDGEIPGTSFADGRLTVAPGTLVGPVRRGA
ncbi:DUF4232 domain-containing protein [Streptomyces sp. NPDC047002]|uniref:DUF4232 domain-containing protein n=1 Tax=Streptomyces sp. NPDC047002 TaxID=3155475 RepID=UPI003455F40A